MRYKHGYHDRWDNHFLNPGWVHTEYYVSTEAKRLHLTAGYIHQGESIGVRGTRFGVNRKADKVSHGGSLVDGHWVGKAENS